MTRYVAFLRAVNVGGTGKLPMADLKRLCEAAGFHDVRTYIASGNVLLTSDRSETQVKAALEAQLRAYAGKPVAVLVRTGAELAAVLRANPFPDAEPKWTVAVFLDAPPAPNALDNVTGRADEVLALGAREIYIAYGAGMGRSKLKVPAARDGTARNLNTVATLAAMAAEGRAADA